MSVTITIPKKTQRICQKNPNSQPTIGPNGTNSHTHARKFRFLSPSDHIRWMEKLIFLIKPRGLTTDNKNNHDRLVNNTHTCDFQRGLEWVSAIFNLASTHTQLPSHTTTRKCEYNFYIEAQFDAYFVHAILLTGGRKVCIKAFNLYATRY